MSNFSEQNVLSNFFRGGLSLSVLIILIAARLDIKSPLQLALVPTAVVYAIFCSPIVN